MHDYHHDIHQKIEELPADLQHEVEDFIDFVKEKNRDRRPPSREGAKSFLKTARSIDLDGPRDWSRNLDSYLYGKKDEDER